MFILLSCKYNTTDFLDWTWLRSDIYIYCDMKSMMLYVIQDSRTNRNKCELLLIICIYSYLYSC